MLSFSQKAVSSKSYPYQVLFAEDVSIFGKEVKQYDYLSNDDLLLVEGNITLFHYSGKVFELSSGSYWTSDLVKKKPKRSFRPMLDPNGAYAINPKKLSGRGCNPGYDDQIQLVIPDNIYELTRIRDQKIELCWALGKNLEHSNNYVYEIKFMNIYDHVLKTVNTKDNFYDLLPDDLDTIKNDGINLDDGLLIFSISVKDHPDLDTEDVGIRLLEADEMAKSNETNYYYGMLEAVFNEYFDENRKAQAFYQYQVRKSNQDPRFIQLYEKFLARNPKIKAETE